MRTRWSHRLRPAALFVCGTLLGLTPSPALFRAEQPAPATISDAQAESQLGDDAPFALLDTAIVHLTTGEVLLADAKACDDRVARDLLLEQARKRFQHADRLLPSALRAIKEQCVGFHRCFAPPDEKTLQRGAALKGALIRAMTGLAETSVGLAETYSAESPEFRTHYEAAAERYNLVYREFRTLVAGLVARRKQADCYRRLGAVARALELYDELVSLPDDLQLVRRLRVSALGSALECRNSAPQTTLEPAILKAEEYLAHLPREEELWPEWETVRYHTARGYLRGATTPNPEASPPGGSAKPERAAWLAKAREHADKLTDGSGLPRGALDALRREIDKIETAGGNGSK